MQRDFTSLLRAHVTRPPDIKNDRLILFGDWKNEQFERYIAAIK
jgi:hypothetical protein